MSSVVAFGDKYRAHIRRAGYRSVSKTFNSRKEAEAWARDLEKSMDVNKYAPVTKELKQTTVADLFTRFATEVSPNRKGRKWEVVRINSLVRDADFTHRRLDQLTASDLRTWRDARLKDISPASVNREMNLISGVFSHAIKEWGVPLPINPVQQISRPAGIARARTRRWTDDDLAKVLEAAGWDEDVKPTTGRTYVGWAILLAIETAMRIGELCSLCVRDYDPAARSATLHDSKNGYGRSVPLSKKAIEILNVLVAGKSADEKIIPVGGETLGFYFREVRNKSGVKDLRFHDCRREAATRLSKKLANVLELSAVTGHRSLQSLKTYYRPTVSELADKLD